MEEDVRTTFRIDAHIDELLRVIPKSLGFRSQLLLTLLFVFAEQEWDNRCKSWNSVTRGWDIDESWQRIVESRWDEVIAWCQASESKNRKTRVLKNHTLDSINKIGNILNCTRDEAFTVGCIVGLASIARLLILDDYELYMTERNEHDFATVGLTINELECDLLIPISAAPTTEELDAFMKKRSEARKKARLERRKAIRFLWSATDDLPPFFAEIFELYDIEKMEDSKTIPKR